MFFKKKKKITELERELNEIRDKIYNLTKMISNLKIRNEKLNDEINVLSLMKMVSPYTAGNMEVVMETKNFVLAYVPERSIKYRDSHHPPEKKLRIKEKT